MTHTTLAWLLSVPLIAVLHELGHALAARPAGYRVTSFGVGHGAPILHWRTRRGTIVYLGRWIFSGGQCVAIPIDVIPERRWLYHSGGLILQALLGLLLWPLAERFPALSGAMWFNLLVLAWNLLPLRFGGYVSDGYKLLAPWLGGARSGQHYAQRDQISKVLRLEMQNRSDLGVAWCRTMLQWMDVVTGQDPDPWTPEELVLMAEPQLEGLFTFVRSEQERSAGASLGALQRIQRYRQDMSHSLPPLSRDMLALAEARCWLDQGSPKKARELLSELVGAPGPIARDAACLQLECALQEEDHARTLSSARRLSQLLDHSFFDLPAASITLFRAAHFLKERGSLQDADHLAARARWSADRALAAALPEDRLPLARRLGEVAGVELVAERRPSSKRLLR
jgi:hypothetical protein